MNALKEFLSKNIKVNSSASLKKDDLLQKYNEFCLESKSELLSSVQFQKQLKEMYPSIQLKRIGRLNGTQLYYEGITFTTSTTCINADDKSPLVLILQKHHQSLSLLLANRRFTDAIQLMQDFWSNFQSTNSDGSEDESFEKLLELEGEFYNNTFNLFFNSNQVLIPIPLDLLLEYRRFSKGILQVAKNGSSSLMLQQQQQESNSWFFLKRRLELLNVFHLLVLKYTTLNHLLQSVQPLFSSEEFISVHLRRELDQLDINQIINEYSLIVVDSTDVESVRQFYDRVYSLLFHTPFRYILFIFSRFCFYCLGSHYWKNYWHLSIMK